MKKLTTTLILSILLIMGITSCSEDVVSKPNFIFKSAPNNGAALKFKGETISEDELYKGIESDLYEAEMKVYEIKMNKLRSLILEKLISSDPKKGSLSNDEFLKKHISSGKGPSAKDIEAFVKERKIPKQHLNDQMKERIKKFLEVELQKKAVELWVAKQTVKNPVEVFINKPSRPVFNVVVGDAPFVGKADAKVTLVEYSDFQCPFCAKGHEVINQIKKKYGNKIKIAFKHFPLPFHNHAKVAAEASMCANEQKMSYFWEFHDAMFLDQAKLSKEDLKAKARKIGLDGNKFDQCLDSGKFTAYVNKDMEDGKTVGVKSTPTFFVNGKLISGAQPIEVFSEVIDSELKL
jgi:protein-disulfide isomerase